VTGLRSSGVLGILAVLGGIVFLMGAGWLALGMMVRGSVFTLLGFILLWWAVAERRKDRVGTPESEANGSHTIE